MSNRPAPQVAPITLTPPYLLFTGSETSPVYAKTAAGLAQWRREWCLGQLRLEGGTVDLGLPHYDIRSASEAGAKTLVIGTAPVGGRLPEEWVDLLVEALHSGMDVAAGLHQRLNEVERLVDAARSSGQKLIDVRVPPSDIPVGTGKKRSGQRLLTVGTDCALGKKYTALALTEDMSRRGWEVDFRATGQTGIMIAGSGIPMDAVVADFLSGAAELLSPDAPADHWDVIEGQGALHHPGFGAVSMGLLLGSQPDAFVVCTEAGRTHVKGWPDFALPTVDDVIELTTTIGSRVNPAVRCVGISVNTSTLPTEADRLKYLADLSAQHGLPAVDPLLTGVGSIVDYLEQMSTR